jgi:hypothetical protein
MMALLAFVPCGKGQSRTAAPAIGRPVFRPNDALTRSGFQHFYNLDYDRAVHDFEQEAKSHPNDPFVVNHLLTAVLFRELYRMGLLDTGSYANDSFVAQPHRPPDPKVQERIKGLIRDSLALCEDRLKKNHKDVNALYARGVARGLRSTYTALVERSWFSGLRSALAARHDHEQVLELDPSYTDAKLIVGIHNYVVGISPLAVKMAASTVGIRGSKTKGLEYLDEVARNGNEARIDAHVSLALFLRREKKYSEALNEVQALISQYPHNFLFALEEPNLLRAAGKDDEAIEGYRRVWDGAKQGRYPNAQLEIAARALGDTLRARKQYPAAIQAYDLVDQVPNADPQVKQKCDLAAGELYDVVKQREQAVRKYQAVIADDAHTPVADLARKRLKQAYRE